MPSDYFLAFIENIITAAGEPQYLIQDGFVLTDCAASWKPIWFMIDNHWIQVDPADYLIDVSANQNG